MSRFKKKPKLQDQIIPVTTNAIGALTSNGGVITTNGSGGVLSSALNPYLNRYTYVGYGGGGSGSTTIFYDLDGEFHREMCAKNTINFIQHLQQGCYPEYKRMTEPFFEAGFKEMYYQMQMQKAMIRAEHESAMLQKQQALLNQLNDLSNLGDTSSPKSSFLQDVNSDPLAYLKDPAAWDKF